MPNVRLTMRNIRDILRLRLAAGLSFRQIRGSLQESAKFPNTPLQPFASLGFSH